jgi:hypothetical protein
MGGQCSIHGKMRSEQHFSENMKGRDHLTDIGIDGKITFKGRYGNNYAPRN